MVKFQEYFLSCCGGWHAAHLRVRVGSYHHWMIERIYGMAQRHG